MVEPYAVSFSQTPAAYNTSNIYSSSWSHTGLTLATLTGPDGNALNNSNASAVSMVASATGLNTIKQWYNTALYFNYPITAGWSFTLSGVCRVHSGSSNVYPMLGWSSGTGTPVSGSTPQIWGIWDIGGFNGAAGTFYAPSANYSLTINGSGAQQLTTGAASSAWWLVWINFTIPFSNTATGWYPFVQPWGSVSSGSAAPATFADNFANSYMASGQGIDFWRSDTQMVPNGPEVAVPPNNVNTAAGVSMAASLPVWVYPTTALEDTIMPGALSSTAYITQPSSGNNGSGYSTTIQNDIDVPAWGDAVMVMSPASGTIGTSGWVAGGGTPQATIASSGLATTAINAGPNEQSAYGSGGTMGGGARRRAARPTSSPWAARRRSPPE